jgi:hypothetical protein
MRNGPRYRLQLTLGGRGMSGIDQQGRTVTALLIRRAGASR